MWQDLVSAPYEALALGIAALGAFGRGRCTLRLALAAAATVALGFRALDPAAPTGLADAALALGLAGLGLSIRGKLAAGAAPPAEAPHVPEARAARAALPHVTDAQFAALMRLAHAGSTAHEALLTAPGRRPDALWLALSGNPRVAHGTVQHDRLAPCFVGALSWLNDAPATAEVHLPAGAHFVAWPRAALREAVAADPELGEALEAELAHDMAARMVEQAPRPARPVPPAPRRDAGLQHVDGPAWGTGAGGSG
ncbi:hypothetical protein ACQ5SO_08925 [Rhodovulum sp. DZ06]|uniref:hypothetical protein n=1 Tax=Rhodovulum sp. DZ06 TaxID=3425126 RepID=UPI003D32AA9D